jgi:hypothetical protein
LTAQLVGRLLAAGLGKAGSRERITRSTARLWAGETTGLFLLDPPNRNLMDAAFWFGLVGGAEPVSPQGFVEGEDRVGCEVGPKR